MNTSSSRAERRRKSGGQHKRWPWRNDSPSLRFALRFFVFLGVLALLANSGVAAGLTQSVTTLVAHMSHAVLVAAGSPARLVANTISGSGAAVRVTSECSGVDLMAFVVAAVLAFPAPLRAKITGASTMILIVVCVNTLRVASLYALAAYWPDLFDVAHHYLWQALLIIVAVSAWSLWAARVNQSIPPVS